MLVRRPTFVGARSRLAGARASLRCDESDACWCCRRGVVRVTPRHATVRVRMAGGKPWQVFWHSRLAGGGLRGADQGGFPERHTRERHSLVRGARLCWCEGRHSLVRGRGLLVRGRRLAGAAGAEWCDVTPRHATVRVRMAGGKPWQVFWHSRPGRRRAEGRGSRRFSGAPYGFALARSGAHADQNVLPEHQGTELPHAHVRRRERPLVGTLGDQLVGGPVAV